jgi:RNA polymerase primary sigma factor
MSQINELQNNWIDPTDMQETDHIVESLMEREESITYQELLTLVPEIEDKPELLENWIEDLSDAGLLLFDAQETDKENNTPEAETPMPANRLDNISTDDLLDVYLAEMAQEPLLTHEEEIELAQQIELGRQAEKSLLATDYNAQQFDRLHAQVEAGQAARERLGRANTRLVISIAKRYRGYGLPFPDLIQDGNVGLMRAVDRYDYRTGNRFSTYATWWIRQAVTRSLANQGRTIRIPVHMGGRIREMRQITERLEMEQGQPPTPEEIAVEMEESPTKIRQMMNWARRPLSLDQPTREDEESELGDWIADTQGPEPEEVTDSNLLSDKLRDVMDTLTPEEARVLRLRYGLQDGEIYTLNQIGQMLDLSRERIRQIERKALLKLRLIAPKYQLEHFLGAN